MRNEIMTTLIVHHIGYIVKNIEKAKACFFLLGFKMQSEQFYDANRKIDVCFIEKDGYVVELIQATSDDSVVSGFADKIGMGGCPYHICYETSDLDEHIKLLRKSGFIMMGKAEPAIAVDNRRVAFLMNAHIGIIELLEDKIQ